MSILGSDQDAAGLPGQLQVKQGRRFAAIDFGAAGQVLTSQGNNQPPHWADAGSGGGGGGSLTPANNYHKVAAASTNADVIKAGAGVVYSWEVYNNSGQPLFVKIYDKAANPNPAVDTPVRTIGVQAGTRSVGPGYDGGINFVNGIAILITRNLADNDNNAVGAGDCVVDVAYV